MDHPAFWFFPSMESTDGQAVLEREFEIFGRMTNLEELSKASSREVQEQWGIPIEKNWRNGGSGNIRVRELNDGEKYILTSKLKTANGSSECELETSADQFQHFRTLAEQGLRKTRYFFPVEGTDFVYEVDVFHQGNGQCSMWVKIDLELPEGMSIDTLPDLPITLEEVRVIPPGKKKPADLSFVRQLFDEEFNLYNSEREERSERTYTKDQIVEKASALRSNASTLSYNDADTEAAIKHNLLETAMLLEALAAGTAKVV